MSLLSLSALPLFITRGHELGWPKKGDSYPVTKRVPPEQNEVGLDGGSLKPTLWPLLACQRKARRRKKRGEEIRERGKTQENKG